MKGLFLYTVTVLSLTGFIFGVGAEDAIRPLKVFILAGQSNMEGHAKTGTFGYIGRDPRTAPILEEMRNPDGTPRVCEKVWISYFTGKGDEYAGKLTAGYGAKGRDPKIGPEFTFGIYAQKLLDEPILIIKTAWGGKSLHTDFRSPSAGAYELNEQQLERFRKRGTDIGKWKADKAKATGHYYRLMVDHVRKVLSDIGRIYPDHDPEQGYELAGFVWFQGWNDMCDGNTYPDRKSPGGYDQYSGLLAHFIRDVRKEFSAPRMPFVIGVMGVGGLEKDPAYFREAMAAPAGLPEFKDNVVAVQTAPYWDPALVAASAKKGRLNKILDTAYDLDEDGALDRSLREFPGWRAIGMPQPEERTWRYVCFDVQQQADKLEKGVRKRFRDVQLPPGMEKWYMPTFDDSDWNQGKAPVGTGSWKHRRTTVKNKSEWGNGELLLMRTGFQLDSTDWESYRLSILAAQGFRVFLNGHELHTYPWWKKRPYYRAIVLTEDQAEHLKKGRNVLAAYANIDYDKKTGERFGAIDLFIEGITRQGREELTQALEEVFPAEDRAIAEGASNAGYHYMGSAKIMAQVGKAFAGAAVRMQRERPR